MSKGYIYLLERVKKHEVKMIFCVRVLNMKKAESELHDMFGDSKIKDITKKRAPSGLFQSHVKIGLTSNPVKRVESINKSKLKNGKTEYFAANWLEILTIILWMNIIASRPYIRLLILIAGIVVYLIYGR